MSFENDTTRAQINNIPEKSHVILLLLSWTHFKDSRTVWVKSKFTAPSEPFYSNPVLGTLSIKLQEPSYHPAVHAFSNLRVASQ